MENEKFLESLPTHLSVYGQRDSYLHDTIEFLRRKRVYVTVQNIQPSIGIARAAYLQEGRRLVATPRCTKGEEKNWDQHVLDFEKQNRRYGTVEWKGWIKNMVVLHSPQWSKTVSIDTATFSRVVESIYE